MKKIIFGIICIFLMNSCSKKYLSGTIYMGAGGGFTGAWQEFQLTSKGELMTRSGDNDVLKTIKTLDSTTTKKLFKKYYKLKIDKDNLDAPGNMYYYIGKRDGKFRNHKITYGHPELVTPSEYKLFYAEFMENVLPDSLVIK